MRALDARPQARLETRKVATADVTTPNAAGNSALTTASTNEQVANEFFDSDSCIVENADNNENNSAASSSSVSSKKRTVQEDLTSPSSGVELGTATIPIIAASTSIDSDTKVLVTAHACSKEGSTAGFSTSDMGLGTDDIPSGGTGTVATATTAAAHRHPINDAFFGRQAQRIARHPWWHLCAALLFSLIASAVGVLVGRFSVDADVGGWSARGTVLGDRNSQLHLAQYFAKDLFYDEDAWDDLLNNVQTGWEVLYARDAMKEKAEKAERDRLRLEAPQSADSCEADWYGSQYMFDQSRLWPIWKVEQSSDGVLSPEALFDICEAEQDTQNILMEHDLCFGCDGTSANGCFQPYSIVLFARKTVQGGMDMTCAELRDEWAPNTIQWKDCAASATKTTTGNFSVSDSCPPPFSPTFVDDGFAESGVIHYTSSIFATREAEVKELINLLGVFDRAAGSSHAKGAYDTQNEDFVILKYDATLQSDTALAMASAIVSAAAILVHTRSPFIMIMGILQVFLSLPLSFFFYKLVVGIDFFPFLNFLSVFVIFSIGADDVFVAFDRFKNIRLDMPNASTVHVASVALPEAASAMFVTTVTTAIAFFAASICPVAPIKCFGIFLGLAVTFDYILNIMLVFPALCIYDATNKNSKFCVRCCMFFKCRDSKDEKRMENEIREETETDSPVFIRRVLLAYYNLLHRVRWPLLLACVAALAVSCYFTSKLARPDNVEIRLLSDQFQFEQNFLWRKSLLSTALGSADQFTTSVVWGLQPVDTGDHSNPKSWTQLVLDDTFEPSSEDAQRHLLNYCPKLYSQEFAPAPSDFRCSIQRFDYWLQDQMASVEPDEAYTAKCNGARGMPMDSDSFHPCLVAWSKMVNETTILSLNERVKIIWFPFASRMKRDNGYYEIDEEWRLIEEFTSQQNDVAPSSVNNSFFSSDIYRIFDSTGQMYTTAYGSAAIALSAAAVVLFFTTRSLMLTIFATVSVGYVLTSVTAILVGLGWTLGYLVSVCFAVLIGISVDFVAHFGHAYASLPGKVDRQTRIQHALITMGPSVLAAALTTFSSALIMVFTEIIFFQKFATVLLLTIAQAVVGSFVVFLTMSDCLGSENPTQFVDSCLAKISGAFCKGNAKAGGDRTEEMTPS